MYLSDFSYKGKTWELAHISFLPQSLIVGPNAVGKSRTLSCLYFILNTIAGVESEGMNDIEFKCNLVFKENNKTISYSFAKRVNQILEEHLVEDATQYVDRKGEATKLLDNDINPPATILVIHSQRDVKNHPIFEKIIEWAQMSKEFIFSNVHSGVAMPNPFRGFDDTRSLAEMYDNLSTSQRERLRTNLNSLGYAITGIEVVGWETHPMIVVAENEVSVPILTTNMSNGLSRVFILLLFLESVSGKEATSCLLVDDLGEGLDYERTVKLGRLLFQHCEENDIQLIATSNDSFLMDVIDIKKWNILSRLGSVVTSMGYKDNPSLFDDFALTGLNNFDFLSSNYRQIRDGRK